MLSLKRSYQPPPRQERYPNHTRPFDLHGFQCPLQPYLRYPKTRVSSRCKKVQLGPKPSNSKTLSETKLVTVGSRIYRMFLGSIPLVAKIRPTASPILLLGVLAPAVTPILTGPGVGIQ